MLLNLPLGPTERFSDKSRQLLESFVSNDAHFLAKLGFNGDDRALFRLYMDRRLDLTKLGDNREIMRSMLESFMKVLLDMIHVDSGGQLQAMLKSDSSFAQIAADYYDVSYTGRGKSMVYRERKLYILFPERIRVAEGDHTAVSVAASSARDQTKVLNLEISGDAATGEILFSGKTVSQWISGAAMMVAPINERMGYIKSTCRNPIAQAKTLNHTVRFFRSIDQTERMYLCITGEFDEGMIVELSAEGVVRPPVCRTDDFSYPIPSEHRMDPSGNTNVVERQNIVIGGGFRVGDDRGGGGGGGGHGIVDRRHEHFEMGADRRGGSDRGGGGDRRPGGERRNVVTNAAVQSGGMSKIGDTSPEDTYNIGKLEVVYRGWTSDMDAAKIARLLNASFGLSSATQDTDFGENCVVIQLVRGGGKPARNYVLYRGSFNHIGAIQRKYTVSGVQPLIMGKMGG